MFVLIKLNDDGVLEVTNINREGPGITFDSEAISIADHHIRSQLLEADYFGDVDFEDDSVVGNLLPCTAAWAIDSERWELWKI